MINENAIQDNDLTIRFDAGDVVITDNNNGPIDGQDETNNSNGDGESEIRIPLNSFAGDIIVNTTDGSDSLTVDTTADPITRRIIYNGGEPTVAPGDDLTILIGADIFDTVETTFTGADSGDVQLTPIDGNNPVVNIEFDEIEPLDNDGSAMNIIFNLGAGNNDAVLEDFGTNNDGVMRLRSTNASFEATTFSVPTASLTVNGGEGTDSVEVVSLDDTFDAELTINGNDGVNDNQVNDIVTLSTAIVLSTDDITIDVFTINANQQLTTGLGGEISLDADRNIIVPATGGITAVNGNISINGNLAGAGAGTFNGVEIRAEVRTNGAGDITLNGQSGPSSNDGGVVITDTGIVRASGEGDITITGTAQGTDDSNGIIIEGNVIASTNTITLNGTGADQGEGVQLQGNGLVSAVGLLTVNGFDGATTGAGVDIDGTATLGNPDNHRAFST